MATLCDVPDNQESEDEFEEEMKQELEKRAREAQKGGAEKYESIYFDSDEDQDEEEQDSRMHKRTDDDLLYDPEEDDQHQKYIDKIRRQYQPRIKTGIPNPSVRPLPNSDAVLNCPACFALLCLDCQRHELYQHQYRAMFVQNCTVDTTQTLKFGLSKSARKKGAVDNGEEAFHPVKCESCSTEVAVFDKDEVYHFFNVVPSHS